VRRIQLAVGLGLLVDATLYVAVVPLLPHYTERFHLDKLGAGLVLAAYPAAGVLGALPAGLLASKIGGRTLMIFGNTVFAAATLAFAFAPSAAVLGLARFVQGVASSICWSAGLAWLTVNAPLERRGAAVGGAVAMVSTGTVIGPAIGGLGGVTSPEVAFLTVTVLAAAATALAILAPPGQQVAGDQSVRRQLSAIRQPLVGAAIGLAAVDAIAAATVDLLAPLALGRHGYSSVQIGAVYLVSAVLGVIAGPVAGRFVDRIGAMRLGAISGAGMVGVAALLAIPLPAPLIVLLVVLLGPLFSALMTALFPLAALGADRLGLGHGAANALTSFAWSAGWVIGPTLGGAIARSAGDSAAYVVSAMLAGTVLAVALLRGLQDDPAPGPAAPAVD
jgi:predicted MFS family arabinose efflux permease